MGFLSYAQNFEDVMLWRALGHISNGVYVDIGAQHPRIDSVSRAFYERGWRGTHVEPVPAFADMLRQDRPDETVLQFAIGAAEGTIELNVFADTGLSTAIPDYAERHQAERGYEVECIIVPVLTLNAALRSLEGKDVHWLKIDVEGFEEQVLRGWNSEKLRPWVLVVEATIPNSPETDFESWEPIVTAAGYRFVYFDGLNRFYVANEHAELVAAFAVPPNIFDAVEVSGLASWGLYNHVAADYEAKLAQAQTRFEQVQARFEQAQACFEQAQASGTSCRRELEELSVASAAHIAQIKEEKGALITALSKSTQDGEVLQQRIVQLEATLDDREQQYTALRIERDTASAKAAQFWLLSEHQREELSLVYLSRSWRASAPLRWAGSAARRARNFVIRLARWGLRQKSYLRNAITGPTGGTVAGVRGAHPESVVVARPGKQRVSRRLSPRATKVYTDLKQIVDEGGQ